MSPEFLKKIAERLGLTREPEGIKADPITGGIFHPGPQAFIGPAGKMKKEDIEKSMAEIRRTAAEMKARTMPVILPAGAKIMPTLDIDWEKLKEIRIDDKNEIEYKVPAKITHKDNIPKTKEERDEMKTPFEKGHGNAAPGAKAPEKERVTIYEAPVYNDEHLDTIREALELLGLHYEISTNRAQVYQPISLGGLWASNKFNIKIQEEIEKQEALVLNLDGGCPHCGENEFEYNENKLSCAHCEKSPLEEPEGKGRPHTDGEPAEGVATYRTTNCAYCGAAPDFERHEPNYWHKGAWFCEPHYKEAKEGFLHPDFKIDEQCSFCDSGKPAEQIDIDGKRACEDCKEPDHEEKMTLQETIMKPYPFSEYAPEISQDEKGPHLVCDFAGCSAPATHEAAEKRRNYKFLCEAHAEFIYKTYDAQEYRPLEPAETDDAADTLAHSVKMVQEILDVDQEKAKDLINTAANAGLNPMNEKEVFKILVDKKITAEAITHATLGQNMKITSGTFKTSDIKEQEKSDLKGLAEYHDYLNDPFQDPRD